MASEAAAHEHKYGARQMRLEAVLLPHALHCRVADAHLLGQHARAPVRGVRRLLLSRAPNDREPHRLADPRLAGERALALVLQEALDTTLHVRRLPAPHGRLGDARLATDRVGSETTPRQQDDAGDLLRRLAIGNEPLQCRPITGPDVQASLDMPHTHRYTDLRNQGNPINGSEH